jgi:arginine utilization regulatory protein
MGRTDNDIFGLFPGADLSRISFLPLLKDFFEGVTITDRHGCVLFVNDEQARIDDMPPAMLSGKKITDIYQVDDGVSPVMLFGETGTGKELLAQSIHNRSSRSSGRYVAVNCAAIPENLLEGILFGTTRGAFTGAVDKPGLFEKAHGGTLLLDEINAMTLGLQAKLLRFLQERKIRRVGSLEERDVDLKIISSVNVNPHVAIAQETLRADLFYRLAVIFIRIPPLRERLQDLPALISHFLSKSNALLNRQITGLSEEVISRFEHYPWPGNVRELEHVIEGAMNLVEQTDRQIRPHHLPAHMALFFEQHGEESLPGAGAAFRSLPEAGKKNERHMIVTALAETLGRPSAAAARLGISPQLMNYKMKKYRINRRDYQ